MAVPPGQVVGLLGPSGSGSLTGVLQLAVAALPALIAALFGMAV